MDASEPPSIRRDKPGPRLSGRDGRDRTGGHRIGGRSQGVELLHGIVGEDPGVAFTREKATEQQDLLTGGS